MTLLLANSVSLDSLLCSETQLSFRQAVRCQGAGGAAGGGTETNELLSPFQYCLSPPTVLL